MDPSVSGFLPFILDDLECHNNACHLLRLSQLFQLCVLRDATVFMLFLAIEVHLNKRFLITLGRTWTVECILSEANTHWKDVFDEVIYSKLPCSVRLVLISCQTCSGTFVRPSSR